jgi:hypothetical protein
MNGWHQQKEFLFSQCIMFEIDVAAASIDIGSTNIRSSELNTQEIDRQFLPG